jgi:Rhodopirellula transposase DDE domain
VCCDAGIKQRWDVFGKNLNEREIRLWAAAEAMSHGYGGISKVARETGLSHGRIRRGIAELQSGEFPPAGKLRRAGGGTKSATERDPGLKTALLAFVKPFERGDPESPLRWLSKSCEHVAEALSAQGHSVSLHTVWRLLAAEGYSMQANRKTLEGKQHPDPDGQFQHISDVTTAAITADQPVISIDAKKRENLGNHKQNGREWRPVGEPRRVKDHDFKDKKLGHVIPYGVLDLGRDEGWVSLGVDGNTAGFAAASLQNWWDELGSRRYPEATTLTITADAGGANNPTHRLWRVGLQEFADQTGLNVHVLHFPPGTSKWNKVEHRLFSFIAHNWRGQPLEDRATIINLIANTKTAAGLKVYTHLDVGTYPTGIAIPDDEFEALKATTHGDAFHPEWNYTVTPRVRTI